MANLFLIRQLCDEKKITLKELSETVGISQHGLQNILKTGSTKIDTLEKISEVLEVHPKVFFDTKGEKKDENLVKLEIENSKLISRLKELEEIIDAYRNRTNYKIISAKESKEYLNTIMESDDFKKRIENSVHKAIDDVFNKKE